MALEPKEIPPLEHESVKSKVPEFISVLLPESLSLPALIHPFSVVPIIIVPEFIMVLSPELNPIPAALPVVPISIRPELKISSSPDDNTAERQFVGHSGAIVESMFSPDNTQVVSVSTDGTIRIWSVESGKEIACLISINTQEWAIITPDQYYTASKNGINALYFMQGLDVFAYEQFAPKLHRPDIVLQRLGRAEPTLIQK